MASVPILSTGRDTAVYLDNSQINRSAEKLNADIIGTEGLKLNKALKDKDTFMRMMEVDPVTLISQGATALQAEKHQEFNDTWAKEFQKYKGNLPMEKEIEMRQHRIALEGWQKRMGANQQRYLHELQLYQSAPSKYNKEAFQAATAALYATGEYETGLLPALGKLNDALDKDVKAYFGSKPKESVQSIKGQQGKIVTTLATGDPKEGAQRVLALLFKDDTGGLLQDAIDEFSNQPEEVKQRYLDKDKNGVIDEREIELTQQIGEDAASFASNPIIRWAMDTKGQRYQTSRPQVSNPPSSNTFGGGGMNLVIDGKKYNFTPPQAMEEPYQLSNKRSSAEYYPISLPHIRKYDITPDAVRVVKGVEVAVQKGESIKAAIIGYDAENNLVRLQPESSDGSLKTNESIIVPMSSIKSQLFDIPINKGGKVVNIGEGVSVSAAKPSGISWK